MTIGCDQYGLYLPCEPPFDFGVLGCWLVLADVAAARVKAATRPSSPAVKITPLWSWSVASLDLI
jgi:hypothetical protein